MRADVGPSVSRPSLTVYSGDKPLEEIPYLGVVGPYPRKTSLASRASQTLFSRPCSVSIFSMFSLGRSQFPASGRPTNARRQSQVRDGEYSQPHRDNKDSGGRKHTSGFRRRYNHNDTIVWFNDERRPTWLRMTRSSDSRYVRSNNESITPSTKKEKEASFTESG